MLLRRITKHVTDQNWFAVFIDFLIVVVGVFIGIQVSNWNDVRQQKATAENYVERIHEDLLANIEDMTQRVAYFTKTRSHALDALAALDRPPESLGKQFLVDVYQASQILPREVGRDTYNEILAVGANNAIANVAVRKRLANYYRGNIAQLSNLANVTSYRELIRENMPYVAQAAIRFDCDDIIATGINGEPIATLPDSCDPVMSSEDITASVGAIIELNMRRGLVRRTSDLDLKLKAAGIFIQRTKMLDEYLKGLQQ